MSDAVDLNEDAELAEIQRGYLFGNCSVFAVELSHRTGWEIVGLFDRGLGGAPYHLACRDDVGMFVDARGRLDYQDFVRPYLLGGRRNLELRLVSALEALERFKRDPDLFRICADVHLDLLLPELQQEQTMAM